MCPPHHSPAAKTAPSLPSVFWVKQGTLNTIWVQGKCFIQPAAVLGKVLLPLQTRLVSASGHKETLIWSPEEAHKVCSPREGTDTCSLESAEQHRVSPGVTQGLWGSLTGTEAGITALPSLQVASEAVRNGECLACRAASDIGRMTRSPRVLPEPTSHPGAPDISACRPHHLPATCSPCSLWKQPHRCHSN